MKDEKKEQEDAKNALVDLLIKEEGVLFVGSGNSSSLGYLGVEGLSDELKRLPTPKDIHFLPEDSLSDIAEKVRINANDEKDYFNLLRKTYAPIGKKHPSQFHTLLVGLGFRAIVTTNYDLVLESSFQSQTEADGSRSSYNCIPVDLCKNSEDGIQFLRDLANGKIKDRVLHIHGFYDNPENIILTTSDYECAYKPETQHSPQLHCRTTLSNYPLVFVGFGMEEAIAGFLRLVQENFNLGSTKSHFGIFSSKLKSQKTEFEKAGIDPIFYTVDEDNEERHAGFKDLLSELQKAKDEKLRQLPKTSKTFSIELTEKITVKENVKTERTQNPQKIADDLLNF
ncbi:MAG: SIR2 family protein [Candidatus Gracilibacteria bacterium]|nr:SIR2 family protein [Candidatus Gracilibacteria bacterium]